MTPKEFRAKVKKILDCEGYVYFDKLKNQTLINNVGSRISLDELVSLSKLTCTEGIVYETEVGYYGDISHNIIIYGFSLFEDEENNYEDE